MIPTDIVIFGATGDLSRHKLIPTLSHMAASGTLPEHARVTAIGRRDLDTAQFAEFAGAQGLGDRLRYLRMDFDEAEAYARLLESEPMNRLFYLAVAPESFSHILENLAARGLNAESGGAWTRVMIEKPFGHDQASSISLNEQLERCFAPEQIYRIDHYLGKETVQNILAFRFGNGMFEQLWNNRHVDHIQITVAEEGGIGTRAAYYDHIGATRDLVQNHILQLVAVLGMEEPSAFGYEELAEQALALLQAVQPGEAVFGQYEGYADEAGVPPGSRTETYVAARLAIDNDRWRGVPVYVRTGKKLHKRISEISVQFKDNGSHLFIPADPSKGPNVLTFRVQPDEGIALRLGVKTPRQNMRTEAVNMEFCYSMTFRENLPDGYERLFADVFFGDFSLALHPCTIVESWRIADAIRAQAPEALPYGPGWGPPAGDALIEKEGRRWLTHESTVCNGITLA